MADQGAATQNSQRTSPAEAFAAGRVGIMVLPFVIALIVGGWFAWQFLDDYRRESAAYSRGEKALDAGDYVGAIDAFGEAGAYRDAPEKRVTTQEMLAPVRSAYLDAMSALESGNYEEAIALLTPIYETLPDFEQVGALMEQARTGRLQSLEREIEIAIARRNWMDADHLLTRLMVLDPEQPDYARRLFELRIKHSPIIYARSGGLYQVGPDLADERVLFNEFAIASPLWSPDRRKVTFFTAEASRSQIASLYVFDYETQEAVLISDQASPDPYLSWSPDSQRIAFVTNEIKDLSSTRDRTYLSIYNITTGEISAVHAPPVDNVPSDAEFVTDVTAPTWSPDGNQLAFVAIRRPSSINSSVTSKFSDIHLVDLTTGEHRNITNQLMPAVAYVSWSPIDDRLLAWESQGGTAWFESKETVIHLIDLSDLSIERLTLRTETTGRPSWAPDGSGYAVVIGDSAVRVRWLPGLRESTIGLDQELSGYLSWSPAGNAVLAVSNDSSKASVIVTIVDGSASKSSLPVVFDGNWPNVGLQWGPFAPPQTETGATEAVPT